MVLDFGDLKTLLMEIHDTWDHGLILQNSDPLCKAIDAWKFPDMSEVGLGKLVRVPFAPTAENLAYDAFRYILKRLNDRFDGDIILEQVTFFETPTSQATIDCRFLDQ